MMDSLKSTARSTRASLSRAKRSLALKFKSLPSLKPGQQISGHKSLSCTVSCGPPAVPPRVDRTTLAKSANPQDDSLFLARLPYDIRLIIYEYVWAAAGTDQHIVQIRIGSPPSRPRPSRQASANRELTHFPCLCSLPKDGLDGGRDGGPSAASRRKRRVNHGVGGVSLGTDMYWGARNQFMRPWCPHWECDYVPSGADYTYLLSESSRRNSFKGDPPWAGPPSPFLGVMLACKRMYLESVVSLYENIRFCFMDYFHLETFLRMTPLEHLRNIRSIHLCECVSVNLFMCEDRTAPRWTAVWSFMPLLERLRELHVWLYPSWVGRGSELPEDNLLRIMYNVRGVPKFVVEIPRDERQEDEVALGKHRDAPFKLIRPIVPELGRYES